jgi:hypothetical protein
MRDVDVDGWSGDVDVGDRAVLMMVVGVYIVKKNVELILIKPITYRSARERPITCKT